MINQLASVQENVQAIAPAVVDWQTGLLAVFLVRAADEMPHVPGHRHLMTCVEGACHVKLTVGGS